MVRDKYNQGRVNLVLGGGATRIILLTRDHVGASAAFTIKRNILAVNSDMKHIGWEPFGRELIYL